MVMVLTITSCKMIDLRTDYARTHQTETASEKGKRLLNETYLKMGYDKLESYQSYSVNSLFTWKPVWAVMPMNSLPGNYKNNIQFNFALNSFDGSVNYLEGRREGKRYGIQSFNAYKKKGTIKEVKAKRETWGLATYHYVIEAPKRLLGADIIRYAGETTFEGQEYDLVYVTWGKDEPHKEHDQWLVFINKETGFTDLTQVTINDFFLPMPNAMKGGTIRTKRANVNGTYLPSHVHILLGGPKSVDKYVYHFTLDDYQFSAKKNDMLYPLNSIKELGDAKP